MEDHLGRRKKGLLSLKGRLRLETLVREKNRRTIVQEEVKLLVNVCPPIVRNPKAEEVSGSYHLPAQSRSDFLLFLHHQSMKISIRARVEYTSRPLSHPQKISVWNYMDAKTIARRHTQVLSMLLSLSYPGMEDVRILGKRRYTPMLQKEVEEEGSSVTTGKSFARTCVCLGPLET